MSANIITFDSQYIADQMRGIDKAKSLVEEAMTLIKNASKHRNWQCNESTEIDNSLQTIANSLNRLNMGIIQTGNALRKGLVSFTELEERAITQADSLSSNLQNTYGFSASNYGQSGKTNLPVSQVPNYDTNIPVHATVNMNNNGTDVNNSFVESILAGLIEAGRVGTYVIGSTVGSFLGAVTGIAKGAIKSFGLLGKVGEAFLGGEVNGNVVNVSNKSEALDTLKLTQWGVVQAGVSGFFGGMDGALAGEKEGKKIALQLYEAIFGKSSHTFFNSDAQAGVTSTDIIWSNIKNGIASIPIFGKGIADLFGVETDK